jgi:hypothetical protein
MEKRALSRTVSPVFGCAFVILALMGGCRSARRFQFSAISDFASSSETREATSDKSGDGSC